MAESVPKCIYCHSFDELVVVDYAPLIRGRVTGKEPFNEFSVIHQICDEYNEKIKICKTCYLEKYPESICSKCGKFTFSYIIPNRKTNYSLSMESLCHCWVEPIKEHSGKWERTRRKDFVEYTCHQKKIENTFIWFKNENDDIMIHYKSINLKNKVIFIDNQFYKVNLYFVPLTLYRKGSAGNVICERIPEQCWMEIEKDYVKMLIHANFVVSIDDPIEIDFNLIQKIDDYIMKLVIHEKEYKLQLNDDTRKKIKDCGFSFKIDRMKFDGPVNDDLFDVKVMKYYHDTKCCHEI
jgi:hypothetical protein